MSKARTEDDQEAKEAKERDEIRADKRREIERELRLSKMSTENRTKILERDQDRDISEKIALGLVTISLILNINPKKKKKKKRQSQLQIKT